MLDMWISNIEQICDIYLEGDNMSVLCLQLLQSPFSIQSRTGCAGSGSTEQQSKQRQ